MLRLTRILSVLLALGSTAYWFAAGAHKGWTQTSIKTEKLDEITGLTYPTYADGFLPGLDFLVSAWGAALIILVLAQFIFKKTKA